MILSFELSMPGIGSWNGKWSGAGGLYAIVKNLGRSQKAEAKGREIIENGSYAYGWNDGWSARIRVREVDAAEARKIRRASRGFYGYDWMVQLILFYGKIQTGADRVAEEGKS